GAAARSFFNVRCFTLGTPEPPYGGEVTERSVMVVVVLPSPSWAFPPSTGPRRAPPARPFSIMVVGSRQRSCTNGRCLRLVMPGLDPGIHLLCKKVFTKADGLHRNSGLPELRNFMRRKTGKHDLRFQRQAITSDRRRMLSTKN